MFGTISVSIMLTFQPFYLDLKNLKVQVNRF